MNGLVYILNRWCRVGGKVNMKTWCETKQTLYTSAFWSFIDGNLTDINTFCNIGRKFGRIKKKVRVTEFLLSKRCQMNLNFLAD